MTSKEALKETKQIILDNAKKGFIKDYVILDNNLNIIEKDLEDYEELKELMGTPIQEIKKRLKVLEVLKNHLYYSQTEDLETSIISKENYNLTIFKVLYEEDFNVIKEWLENGKD